MDVTMSIFCRDRVWDDGSDAQTRVMNIIANNFAGTCQYTVIGLAASLDSAERASE
jgi:hypothetical protein